MRVETEITPIWEEDSNLALYDDPAQLAEAVLETIAAFHSVHRLYEAALRKAKVAECDYKLFRAEAYLKAEGTQGQREAIRDVESDTAHRYFQIADAEADAMKERLITLRNELVAYQSLLARLRAERGVADAAHRYDT